MSLLSSSPFSKVTTYRKDYVRMNTVRPSRQIPVQEFKDPIAGPLEDDILPNFKYKNLPENLKAQYPEPKEYAEHVAETYPSTRILLRCPPGGPLDLDAIDRLYANENRSTYMVSYCLLGDFDSKRKRHRTTRDLPEDYVIPLTTHRSGYRDPRFIDPEGVAICKPKPIKDNLVPRAKEQEILEVTTGESVYMADIGKTGLEIISGKLHGDVNVRPHFDQDDLLKAKLIHTD